MLLLTDTCDAAVDRFLGLLAVFVMAIVAAQVVCPSKPNRVQL